MASSRVQWNLNYQNMLTLVELPVLTTHGNPPLAIGGPLMATGGGKLAFVEPFPPLATGGPPMVIGGKIRK